MARKSGNAGISNHRTSEPLLGPLIRPCTPIQESREVSAFSPYNTPGNHSLRARDSGLSPTRRGGRPLRTSVRSDSLPSVLDSPTPAPGSRQPQANQSVAFPTRKSSVEHFNISRTASRWSLATSTRRSSTFSSDTSLSLAHLHTAPPVNEVKSPECTAQYRARTLEENLDAISTAIDAFPSGLLRLDSPVIINIRTPHSLDESHIAALQRVLPETAIPLLSSLSALLIADSYLSKITNDANTNTSLKPSCPGLVDRRCRTLGDMSQLSDTPPKAKALLGIRLPDLTPMQVQQRTLVRNAYFIRIGVGVMGRKMMETICGRCDEFLWRTLRVLVEVVEEQGL